MNQVKYKACVDEFPRSEMNNKILKVFDLSNVTVLLNHSKANKMTDEEFYKIFYNLFYLLPDTQLEIVTGKNKSLAGNVMLKLYRILVSHYDEDVTDDIFCNFLGRQTLKQPLFTFNKYIQDFNHYTKDEGLVEEVKETVKSFIKENDWSEPDLKYYFILYFLNKALIKTELINRIDKRYTYKKATREIGKEYIHLIKRLNRVISFKDMFRLDVMRNKLVVFKALKEAKKIYKGLLNDTDNSYIPVSPSLNAIAENIRFSKRCSSKSRTIFVPICDIDIYGLKDIYRSLYLNKITNLQESNLIFYITGDSGIGRKISILLSCIREDKLKYGQILFITDTPPDTYLFPDVNIGEEENIHVITCRDVEKGTDDLSLLNAIYGNTLDTPYCISDYGAIYSGEENDLDGWAIRYFLSSIVDNKIIMTDKGRDDIFGSGDDDDSIFAKILRILAPMREINYPISLFVNNSDKLFVIDGYDDKNNAVNVHQIKVEEEQKDPDLGLDEGYIPEKKSIDEGESEDIDNILSFVSEYGLDEEDIDVYKGEQLFYITLKNIPDEKKSIMLSDFKKHLEPDGIYNLHNRYIPYLYGRDAIRIIHESERTDNLVAEMFHDMKEREKAVYISAGYNDTKDSSLVPVSKEINKHVDLTLIQVMDRDAAFYLYKYIYAFNVPLNKYVVDPDDPSFNMFAMKLLDDMKDGGKYDPKTLEALSGSVSDIQDA